MFVVPDGASVTGLEVTVGLAVVVMSGVAGEGALVVGLLVGECVGDGVVPAVGLLVVVFGFCVVVCLVVVVCFVEGFVVVGLGGLLV